MVSPNRARIPTSSAIIASVAAPRVFRPAAAAAEGKSPPGGSTEHTSGPAEPMAAAIDAAPALSTPADAASMAGSTPIKNDMGLPPPKTDDAYPLRARQAIVSPPRRCLPHEFRDGGRLRSSGSRVHVGERWQDPSRSAGLEQQVGGVSAVSAGDLASQLVVQIRAGRGGERGCQIVHDHVRAGDRLTTSLGARAVLVQSQVALLERGRGTIRRAALKRELRGEVDVEVPGVKIGREVGRVAGREDRWSEPVEVARADVVLDPVGV